MSPYKKLFNNSFLFAVGNFGSKLIAILLVPLYTYSLTPQEYGAADLIITTTSMLLPLVSLSVHEAVLRYAMDKKNDKDKILTNGTYITVFGSIAILGLYPILYFFNILNDLLIYMIVILILQSFQILFAQYTRAIGNIKQYALNGILMSLITGIVNILFLVYLKRGVIGYLESLILSNLSSIIYLFISSKIHNHIHFSSFDILSTKKMLKYSIPLIPNSFMWWVISASNRYFIYLFVGPVSNGLFAVANKIPSLLSILNSIFFQAWQLSAIEEYNSKNKSQLYSNVFNYFSFVMFLGTSGILVILKIVISFTIEKNYYNSWKLVPFLLLGVLFSSFSSFLGTNYVAAKETTGIFKTSIYGGIISILSNLFFIPRYGANGAGISTLISFLVIWIVRMLDTKKYINIKIEKKLFVSSIFIIAIQILILYLKLHFFIEFLLESILFLIVILIYKKYFLSLLQLFIK